MENKVMAVLLVRLMVMAMVGERSGSSVLGCIGDCTGFCGASGSPHRKPDIPFKSLEDHQAR
ncbi:hypothetical protein AMTRI_Chr03g140290 [Amborella trichopoda]